MSRICLVHYKGISIATLGDVSRGFDFAMDGSHEHTIFSSLQRGKPLASKSPELGGLEVSTMSQGGFLASSKDPKMKSLRLFDRNSRS